MSFVIGRKISDIGSSEPWSARMWIEILNIRDHAFEKGKTREDAGYKKSANEFDKIYKPLLNNLEDAFKGLQELEDLISRHEKDLTAGKIIETKENQFFVVAPIDQEVRRLFRGFVGALATALKQSQYVCANINTNFDFGFLFAKDDNFKKGVKAIENNSSVLHELSDLFKSFRVLSTEIITFARNPIEHPKDGFVLPDIEYDYKKKKISNDFYSKEKLRKYWENSWRFCEIVIVSAFATKIEEPWGIVEIPKTQRDHNLPVKYKPWIIDDAIIGKIQDHVTSNK